MSEAVRTAGQTEITKLTYEQEVYAMLWASAANTVALLQYFQAQAKAEKGEARKLTEKVIAHKQDDLRRLRELIPQALERRDFPTQEKLMDSQYHAGAQFGWNAAVSDMSHEEFARILIARSPREKRGNCEVPHFLGEPTSDHKALTQRTHYESPACKNWRPC